MEVKKSPKADLEGKRTTNLLVGAILTLAVMFIAFEWSEREKKIVVDSGVQEIVFEEEMIPITEQEPPKQAPPPPEAPKMEEIIEIVENDAEVEETTIEATDDINTAVAVSNYQGVAVEEEEVDEQEIFQVVEEMPSFPGGQQECMKWLGKNMKYPQISMENGVQGRVIVQFVVNKDGSIVEPVVVRGVDPYLDKEALRVISMMPKWTPGKQRGKPVRVKFTVPVTFKLQ